MSFSPSRLVVHVIAIALVAATPVAASAASEIGTATSIKTSVTGTLDDQSIILKTGDDIFARQSVATDAGGVGQFEFRDKTKLAIGPGSTVILDDFIYNPKTSGSKVVLDLTRGSFRFITGKANHDAYEITTPTATIGVRGTAFDVYVGDSGEMAIAMINGAVEVCPHNAACRLHNIVGRFLHMSVDGVFSLHDTWDGSFLGGVALKAALPFMDDQRLLVPALRGSTKIVATYVGGTTTTVGNAIKSLATPKLKLRSLKLPKLFK
jgi:hypothetical protein